jgi:hypothetical protein
MYLPDPLGFLARVFETVLVEMMHGIFDRDHGLVQGRLPLESIVRLWGGRSPRVRVSVAVGTEIISFIISADQECRSSHLHKRESRRLDREIAPGIDPLYIRLPRVR